VEEEIAQEELQAKECQEEVNDKWKEVCEGEQKDLDAKLEEQKAGQKQ
jgi:hypothetical protein